MSGPILITTSTYNGPERRGKLMTEHEDKRQTNEVAIARLEVNVETMKEQMKVIDEKLTRVLSNSCTDCATARVLNAHIEDHKMHANAKWDRTKWVVTTVIAIAALVVTITSKAPAAAQVISSPTVPYTSAIPK